MPSTKTIGSVAKLIIEALETGGQDSALKAMADNGIGIDKAITALAHRKVPISDTAKLKAVRTFVRRDVPKFGFEAATPSQIQQLADTIGDVTLRERGQKVAKLFRSRSEAGAATKATPRVAPVAGAASKGSPMANETRKRVAGRISELLGQRRQLQEAVEKTATETGKAVGDLQKQLTQASGPRYAKAAALLGGGLALGSMSSAAKAPQNEAARQMIAELITNQQGGVDRQKLVDAQAELTKARTFEVLNRILNAGQQTAKANPFG